MNHDDTTTYRITGNFLTGAAGRVQATLKVQDLTHCTNHHEADLQLLHITFDEVDHDAALDVLRGMGANFLDFYRQMQNPLSVDPSPLALPTLSLTEQGFLHGPDWVSGLEVYLQGALRFHEEIEAQRIPGSPLCTSQDCSVCSSLIIVRYPAGHPKAGQVLSIAGGAVCHCRCVPETPPAVQPTYPIPA